MSHDATLRSAALLLRKGHPPDVLLDALDDETAWSMTITLLGARPVLVDRMARRFAEAEQRRRDRAPASADYIQRRDARRAAGLAVPDSCLDLESWGDWNVSCAACQGWSTGEGCRCGCPLCRDVAEHLDACQRCPGDPCSGYMAERLGLVAPRSPA